MSTPLLDVKNKIIMGFTPRAGCTVAVKMFFDHMGLLKTASDYPGGVHKYRLKKFNKQFKVTDAQWKNKKIFKFKIVRNPYHRAVSSYFMYLNLNKAFLSFYDFLSLIQNPNQNNPHWDSQCQWYDAYFNKIIKLENLEKEIEDINKLIGSNFKTGYTSYHHHVKLPPSHFVGKKKFRDSKQIPNYKDFYNKEIKDTVYKIYRKDFERYRYSIDIKVL